MKSKFSGKFIIFDGPDGCGKSTQAKLLAQWLEAQGVVTAGFRDPGDTAIGEKVRAILLNPEHITITARTELLLYMAARAQLWAEKIAPALGEDKCVILDRWLSSTCAYQGYAGGFGIGNVINIATGSLVRLWPDLTIILDIGPDNAALRLDTKLDRIEQKGRDYHQKVREGFLKLAGSQENFFVVDASEDIQTVHKKVVEIITQADFK